MSHPPAPKPSSRDFLNTDSLLTDDELLVKQTVRRFVDDQILDHVGEWFERGEFPVRELAPELGKLGMLGMHLDGYGCAGASGMMYGLACLELEAGDSGLRSFVSVQGSLAMFPIHAYGSDEQKETWLPPMAAGEAIGCFGLTEPDSGSDPASMRTTARQVAGGDWVLNGTKMWITNGPCADVAVVWARTERGIRGFVVPTDVKGFTANEVSRKISLRASLTGELVLDDVRLPESAVLPGVASMRGPLSCLSEARYGILFGAVGAARACYEEALEYSLSREQFGRPIAGFQLTQAKLADFVADVSRGTLLAYHLGRLKDDGQLHPSQVSLGKRENVAMALRLAREARSVLGANGITTEYSIARHMVNLESVYTYEGTHEIHTLIVGQELTGVPAFS